MKNLRNENKNATNQTTVSKANANKSKKTAPRIGFQPIRTSADNRRLSKELTELCKKYSSSPTEKKNKRAKASKNASSPLGKKVTEVVLTNANIYDISVMVAKKSVKSLYAFTGEVGYNKSLTGLTHSISLLRKEGVEKIKDFLMHDLVHEAYIALLPLCGRKKKMGDFVLVDGREYTLYIYAIKWCENFIKTSKSIVCYPVNSEGIYVLPNDEEDLSSSCEDVEDEFNTFLRECMKVMGLENAPRQKAVLLYKYNNLRTEYHEHKDTYTKQAWYRAKIHPSNAEIARVFNITESNVTALFEKLQERAIRNFAVSERTIAVNTNGIEEFITKLCGAFEVLPDGTVELTGEKFF